MKLTPDAVVILKNFAVINQSMLFKKGSTLSTISGQKNTLAFAKVKDKFPKEFAIYDLNTLLSILSLYSDPNIEIKDNHLEISGGETKSSVKFYFSDPSMIVLPPEDISKMEKVIKSAEINFKFTEDVFQAILKASAVLGSPEIAIESDGKTIDLVAQDVKNSTSNSYSVNVGEGNGTTFKMIFKTDALKMLKGSYDVSVSSAGISHFKNTEIDLQYYISLEATSVYIT